IHPAQTIVRLDLACGSARRRLAHEAGGELPIVIRVQGGGVENQNRHFVTAAPIVILGLEIRIALRVNSYVGDPPWPLAEFIFDQGEQLAIVKAPQAIRHRRSPRSQYTPVRAE